LPRRSTRRRCRCQDPPAGGRARPQVKAPWAPPPILSCGIYATLLVRIDQNVSLWRDDIGAAARVGRIATL
jgi:hypothetical protein